MISRRLLRLAGTHLFFGFVVCLNPLGAANAQNLLASPAFDSPAEIDDWINLSPSYITVSWDALDLTGDPASGSAHILNTSALAQISGIMQCVQITEGANYRLSGWVFVPSGVNPARGWFDAFFLESNDCSLGSNLGIFSTPSVDVYDEWVFVETEITAPAGALSARIEAFNLKTVADGQSMLHVDGIRFALEQVPVGISSWSAVKARYD